MEHAVVVLHAGGDAAERFQVPRVAGLYGTALDPGPARVLEVAQHVRLELALERRRLELGAETDGNGQPRQAQAHDQFHFRFDFLGRAAGKREKDKTRVVPPPSIPFDPVDRWILMKMIHLQVCP